MNMVQYINYKDKKYPVRISYYAIKKFQEETKKDITEIDKDITLLEVLLWYGIVAGSNSQNEEMTLKREEMEFILDESMSEFNDIIAKSFPLPSEDNKKK